MPGDAPRRDGLEPPTMRYVETKVSEAPMDGGIYARQNGMWVEISATPLMLQEKAE
jgi:hypothetical protein